MLPASFHPATIAWFNSQFTAPTKAQALSWPAIIQGQHTLIAAPTGSGKTLAAFLATLDALFQQAINGTLLPTTYVVYVSPLKALGHDINKNLQQPLQGIADAMQHLHPMAKPVLVTAAVRTGDTPAYERQKISKKPPHVLVTTPESLYLLLTSQSGQRMLQHVHTVIVDEIHAMVGNKRGSHLSLSLERLQHLVQQPLQRIGLSATQKPIEEVARFLVGRNKHAPDEKTFCHIVDTSHQRQLDLALELPKTALAAVMSHETWQEIYEQVVEHILAHRTTLIFVNTRRMAERVTHQLSQRLGETNITSHHGSLSTPLRLAAEQRLKNGELKALVATSSLELGIDIGAVDLVIQLGSVRHIATLLQRIGRAAHNVGGIPKGRLFPLTRDELVESTALLQSIACGNMDTLEIPLAPLDILAQQIVAATATEDWLIEDLYQTLCCAYPYQSLPRETFTDVINMLATGFNTRRGRRSTLVHIDAVNQRIRGRRGARLTALTCGGAIADNADYKVVIQATGVTIGSINEEYAIDSTIGDIFQLGNNAWRLLKVTAGTVFVENAQGQSPSMPFWFGQAPSRSNELSQAISQLFQHIETALSLCTINEQSIEHIAQQLAEQPGLPINAMLQLVTYLAAAKQRLGALPNHQQFILERFFDESGGMQLVLHAPFGSRINRAWGLALRKRFCRSFNFELQAAANENALLLSLGEVHSFALADVFAFLHPNTIHDVLTQALLDSPMFQSHWRWNATRALAILRFRGGQKTPPHLLRMQAEDLVAAVFPDQLACLENIVGKRRIPKHPLVNQTIDDCLTEAMDIDGLVQILTDLQAGNIHQIAVDTPEPSVLSHEIIHARPYAFLDDTPLEERRTRAVLTRRGLQIDNANQVGALDILAIDTVRQEAWPKALNPDEVHDALLQMVLLNQQDAQTLGIHHLETLATAGRAVYCQLTPHTQAWFATENCRLIQSAYPQAIISQKPLEHEPHWQPDPATEELVRGQLQVLAIVTQEQLAAVLGLEEALISQALLTLENQGYVLRGYFYPNNSTLQWCERRLLARINRLTIAGLRRDMEPVSLAHFMRFLCIWQHAEPEHQNMGPQGLLAVLQLLEGLELPAYAWEHHVLPARVKNYDPSWLDDLCQQGEIMWGRIAATADSHKGRRLTAQSPITLWCRANTAVWAWRPCVTPPMIYSSAAQTTFDVLTQHGAQFYQQLKSLTGLLPSQQDAALAELVSFGLIQSDGFAGLRELAYPHTKQRQHKRRLWHRPAMMSHMMRAGRWSIIQRCPADSPEALKAVARLQAQALLRRYGVVFKSLLWRETNTLPYQELLRALRQAECRGEVRGGYFIEGVSGEQFAAPEALELLRNLRKIPTNSAVLHLSAADPLNHVGVLTAGTRIATRCKNRLVYQNGVAQIA